MAPTLNQAFDWGSDLSIFDWNLVISTGLYSGFPGSRIFDVLPFSRAKCWFSREKGLCPDTKSAHKLSP